jgi:serine/threonine protein kinase
MNADKIIQNYRLVRKLGEGGMGEVWMGQHTQFDRKVAVKCLHPQLLKNEGIRARFKQEASTLAKLQHPNIVALYDYFEDQDGAYLVMEYVEGTPMDEYIAHQSGPVPTPTLNEYLKQILDGFAYAHKKSIVHRDIKPSNFMVTSDGTIKILDFGIAKILGAGDHKLTKTGTHLGTVLYMSPEQVKGGDLDQRSDIYSLGVTLFHLATGQSPYRADTTEFVVYDQIVNHPLPLAVDRYPGVDQKIQELIMKATEKEPANRFQDCNEFLSALKTGSIQRTRLDSSHPSAQTVVADTKREFVPSPQQPVAAVQSKPRSRTLFLGIGAIVFILAAVTVIFLVFLPKEKGMYVIASGLFIRSSPDSEAKTTDKIPYGTEIQPIGEVRNGWVEIEFEGKKGFVSQEYLVDRKNFLALDRICANADAKELLRESTHKRAVKDYFTENGFEINLSEEEYEEVHGGDRVRDPSKTWQVNGLPMDNVGNNAILSMKLEKGKWNKNEKRNNVVIIENVANPINRKMVAFRHVKKDGNWVSTDIGAIDISDYPGALIRSVDWKAIGQYSFTDWDPLWAAKKKFDAGKEAILLEPSSKEYAVLYFWESLNQFSSYDLVLPSN